MSDRAHILETDVLITGGGLSGLSVADHLARTCRDFLLIEAQPRLGGRIMTQTVGAARFDLGPAWFWLGQPRMDALVGRFDLPVFAQFGSGDQIFQSADGRVHRGQGLAAMHGTLRLDGGMGLLIDALARAISRDRLRDQTALRALHREGARIVATAQDANGDLLTIRANQVVLALPPRLVANAIAFDPPLDGPLVHAFQEIPTWMAAHAKILAVYETDHWRAAGLSGHAVSQRGPLVEIHDASPACGGPFALFGFVGVPAHGRNGRRRELLDAARAQLGALFGPKAAEPKELFLQDWADEPMVATPDDQEPPRGHPRYGLPPAQRTLWDGRLILSSTETAPSFGGFLEGALEAAEMTIESLKVVGPGAN